MKPARQRRVLAVAIALLVAASALLAGCSQSNERDPAREAPPPGKGALLANIVREGDQARLEGVTLLVYGGGYGTSDANGHVIVSPLNPGHYRAVASKTGYEGAPVEFDIKADEYTEIPVFMSPTSNTG